MASEQSRSDGFTAVEDMYSGYTVYDKNYEKIGRVDDLFVDENDTPEYIGVKMGFLGTKSTLIPFEIVRVNDEQRVLEIASDKEQVKNGPSFDDDREITPEFEREVHAYYGVEGFSDSSNSSGGRGDYSSYYSNRDGDGRVDLHPGERQEEYNASSGISAGAASGYAGSGTEDDFGRGESGHDHDQNDVYDQNDDARATGDRGREPDLDTGSREDSYDSERHDSSTGNVGPGMSEGDVEGERFREHAEEEEGLRQPGSDLEDEDELRVSRSEEELRAGTCQREAGSMRVRKRVRTDRERIEVPTKREEVSVERVPVNEEASEAEIGEDEVSIPVVEEEVVVSKRAVKKEEIRVRKDVVEDTEIVEEDVRREEVDVEDATERGRALEDNDGRSGTTRSN